MSPPDPKSSNRLSQLSSHLSPTNSQKQSTSSLKSSPLPADYSDITSTLSELRTIASTPPTTSRGYNRQLTSGKLWVRSRVLSLFDPESFHEIGSVSGTVTWKPSSSPSPSRSKEEIETFIPSNNVQGFAKLAGRKVVFTADDFSIRAGHADGAMMEKTIYMEKLAISLRLPMIKLVDGSSGGGSVTTIRRDGFSYLPPMPSYGFVVQQLNMGIPNLGAVLGPAVGLGAARVVSCHWSVMARDIGSLFNAGPRVVAGATFEEDLTLNDLGGPEIHCTNGTIDNLAANEAECFAQLRTILSFLPNSGASIPPTIPISDPPDRRCINLRTLIPRRKARMYDARQIITSTVDSSSFFEIGTLWGTTAIVGLARLAGRPLGIISLNCEVSSGALDAAGSQKITRHLKFCDVFNIPILQFVDVPGYAIGTVAERAATMRWGVELAKTYFATTVDVFSVVTRRVYGVAGGIMLDCRDPRMRVAWPSGEWGSLPLAGGIEVGHAAELAAASRAGNGKEVYEKLEDEYTRLMNPVRTANAFGVEEIIDPADTRRIVAEWLEHVYEELLPVRLTKRASGEVRPVFY